MAPYIMSDNMTYKREKVKGRIALFSICELLKLTVFEHLYKSSFHMFNLKTAPFSLVEPYNRRTTQQPVIYQFEKMLAS